MAGRLKAVELDNLTAGNHGDGGGLYLVVQDSKSCSRSWILRTVVCGKRCEIGLGSYPLVGLAKAREKAATLRSQARNGKDILAERRAAKAAEQHASSIPTFESLAGIVLQSRTTGDNAFDETHAYNWIQSLRTYVFPIIGKKTVDKIDSADILAAIGPIWTTIPDTAGRILRRVKTVLDYSIPMGYRDVTVNGVVITLPNPCDTIRAVLPKRNSISTPHEAIPYAQLPAFVRKLRTAEHSAIIVRLALEFLILTCARTSEVLESRWTEFDLVGRVWNIPKERMKMKAAHKVPLAPRCIEILQLARQFNDAEIVFPGRYAGHALSNMALNMAMRRMGHEAVPHGFRATFKTWAEETTEYDSLVIEACMAHKVKGIERHYLRTTFFDQRKKLMNDWARFATGSLKRSQ
jgi:integrase